MELAELITAFSEMPNRPSIGLALGGGAARGLAHIGVLAVLEEIGLPIDCICGTSAGAIAGAAWSSGMTSKDMYGVVRETEWWFLARTVSLKGGLLNSRGIERWLETFLPCDTFAQLKTPLAVVATDFRRGEPVMLSEGSLVTAVSASCSIPGIYRPVSHAGRQLVDGGLVANLPVSACRDFGADFVIAVDVHSNVLDVDHTNTIVLSLIQAANILMMHHENEQRALSDILVQPRLGEFSATSFREVDALVDLGEQAAYQAIPSLKELLLRLVGGN